MSRLDQFIHRVTAQKNLLEHVAGRLNGVAGPILELKLGNGRIYDHLRQVLPDREIFAFDRLIRAHPSSVPDGDHMIVGDLYDTLKYCHQRTGRSAVLIHCALGTGDPTADLALADWLGPLVADLTGTGGYVICDLPLVLAPFEDLEIPDQAHAGQFRLCRKLPR
jgi:hypothetical protein